MLWCNEEMESLGYTRGQGCHRAPQVKWCVATEGMSMDSLKVLRSVYSCVEELLKNL